MQNRMKEIVNHVDKVSPGISICPSSLPHVPHSASTGMNPAEERLALVG